ncbi:MAG: hypothetical protein EPN25_01865 [Nitrospirae bacterium]|nr:MAG: hypothetical protein EPN25_01865 [Nitrospirota bacterium]
MRSFELISAVSCFALLFMACAPTYKARIDAAADAGIVWPGKPEKPRIRYLWSLHSIGAQTAEGERSYLDILAGNPAGGLSDPRNAEMLLRPQGIYVDDRRYYIADPGAARVTVIDRKTMDVLQLTGARGEDFEYPISVVAAPDGRIYVADSDLNKVFIFGEGGAFLSSFEGEFVRSSGLAIDRVRGVIYVVDTLGHAVMKHGLDGKRLGSFGKRGEADGEFNYPGYAFVDDKGRVYISDSLNFRVQIFSPEGTFISKFGELGDSYDTLEKPKGVAVDREGHIYVVDGGKDMVKIFDREGRLLLYFGEQGQKYGDFYLPTGIFIDKDNVIYVADNINMRIQAFQFLGGE